MYILLWLILTWQSSGLSTLLHRSPKKKLFSEENVFFNSGKVNHTHTSTGFSRVWEKTRSPELLFSRIHRENIKHPLLPRPPHELNFFTHKRQFFFEEKLSTLQQLFENWGCGSDRLITINRIPRWVKFFFDRVHLINFHIRQFQFCFHRFKFLFQFFYDAVQLCPALVRFFPNLELK